MSKKTGAEKRKTPRRPILDSFSLFIVIPKKGMHRLKVYDVSEQGLGFDYDAEGEDVAEFPAAAGESLDVHFYLNQSLFLPLSLKITRIEQKDLVRRVGAELTDKNSKETRAFVSFVQMLDSVIETAQLASG